MIALNASGAPWASVWATTTSSLAFVVDLGRTDAARGGPERITLPCAREVRLLTAVSPVPRREPGYEHS
jgi:hypothetical protein